MRYITFLSLLILSTTGIFCQVLLSDLLHKRYEFFSQWQWAPYLLDSALINHKIIHDFSINQKGDTIFVLYLLSDEGHENVKIWNGKNAYWIKPINDTVCIEKVRNASKKNYEFSTLIPNWETDVLRYLGNTTQVYDGSTTYITRYIVKDDKITIDTVHYTTFYFTNEEMDSIRETLYFAKHTKLIPTSIQLDEGKTVSTQSPNMHSLPKTLWQRIVDWFRNLWHSIFG